jgi:hypothetical protein
MRRSECDLQFICIYKFSDFMSMYTKASDKRKKISLYTVTKSEPNEASLCKITLQKRGNSHVDTGTFIPPLTRFLYILLCGKSVPVYGREHFYFFHENGR